jgi:sortase A
MSDEGSPRWARIVGGVGKGLIAAGVLILLFVVYQLWGTDLQEASSQSDLKSRFNDELVHATVPTTEVLTTTPTTTVPVSNTTVPTTDATPTTAVPITEVPPTTVTPPAFVTEFHPGDPVARLEIDKIGVDKIVVAGTDTADLRKGPGHYANTPLPGQLGNAAIAGHRTTFGAPFRHIDELDRGDTITLTLPYGEFRYRVFAHAIVDKADWSIIRRRPAETLVLSACHPLYGAAQRWVVFARLAPPEPTLDPGRRKPYEVPAAGV